MRIRAFADASESPPDMAAADRFCPMRLASSSIAGPSTSLTGKSAASASPIASARAASIVALGATQDDATMLGEVAVLHDIGKIVIPDSILCKPGPLTPAEFEIMKRHPAEGARLLRAGAHPFFDQAALVAAWHHERWDGSGYPDHLRGEECPLDARIVAVADVYDALGQARCYKAAWSPEQISAYFAKASGTQFEPKIVDALFDSLPRLRELAVEFPDSGTFPTHQ